MRKFDIKGLYYITHIENLPSILDRGILSHARIEALNVPFTPIYDSDIVSKRKDKSTPNQKSLWDYANLYFQPRNPMMYRVVHEKGKQDLAVVGVVTEVLQEREVIITNGNAANEPTQFYSQSEGLKMLQKQWKIIQNDWWNNVDGSKRKIMAECLVPNQVGPEHIHSIFVANHAIKTRVEEIVGMRWVLVGRMSSDKTPVVLVRESDN
jgi:hypothetical protein